MAIISIIYFFLTIKIIDYGEASRLIWVFVYFLMVMINKKKFKHDSFIEAGKRNDESYHNFCKSYLNIHMAHAICTFKEWLVKSMKWMAILICIAKS